VSAVGREENLQRRFNTGFFRKNLAEGKRRGAGRLGGWEEGDDDD